MSNALLRRNSSKQGLQNLMRLTAQRSIEDAEEIERERRRRAREDFRRRNSGSMPEESSPENETPVEEYVYSSDLKPSSSPSLEEDEGFSDWTQRRERRRQQRLQELSHGGEEEEDEEEAVINKPIKSTRASITSSGRLQRHEEEEKDRKKECEEEAIRAERESREKELEKEEKRKREQVMIKRRSEIQSLKPEEEKRKEVKVSYTSKVFLHQEPKVSDANRDPSNEVKPCIINKTKRSTGGVNNRVTEPEESEAIAETEQRLEKIRRSLQAKESQEMEQLKQRQVEAEQDLEKLKRRREDRRRIREEEERRREEEEQQRLAKEEEERRRMKEDIERRRMEAAERMKSLTTPSVDGDEVFSPVSPKAPTQKISERTESLNRSLKKSNSFKKMQPFLLTAKIDDKMEQYAHAVETSQEARAVKASLSDLASSPEVTSKKNLFEAGEAWNQSPTRPGSFKEVPEGLKVGVANLITQWVKGPSDSSRQTLCRPTDVKPGDVMQKKNMWEIIGDSSGSMGPRAKGSAAGKKYKFVVTGHGKYEKIPVGEGNEGEFTNGKSGLFHSDY